MPKSPDSELPTSFEEAMGELDGIVQAMEGDQLSLAELIEQYARGTKLEKVCREQLAVARQRVEMIAAAADGSGDLEVTEFDPENPATQEEKVAPAGSGGRKSKKENEDSEDEIRLF